MEKSYQRLEKEDFITEPKTEKSKRELNLELELFICVESERCCVIIKL